MQVNLDRICFTTYMIGLKFHTLPILYQLFTFVGRTFLDLIFLFCILKCANFQTVYLSLANKGNVPSSPSMGKLVSSHPKVVDISNSALCRDLCNYVAVITTSVNKMAIVVRPHFGRHGHFNRIIFFQTHDISDPVDVETPPITHVSYVQMVEQKMGSQKKHVSSSTDQLI